MSEDIQIRAARAQQLLEDEVLAEAIISLSQDAADRVDIADLSNAAQCIAAVASAQAAANFVSKLKGFVTSGKAAERKPFKVA
jgi:hypothetical protein